MEESSLTRRAVLASTLGTVAASAGCAAMDPPATDQGDRQGLDSSPTGGQEANATRFEQLFQSVGPAVIELKLPEAQNPFDEGAGSGFLTPDDLIVTNAHVVMDFESVEIRFANGEWSEGTVRSADLHSDLAVVEPESIPSAATELSLTTRVPSVGEEVMAIGSPRGFGGSATTGIVSGVNRSLPSPTGFSIPASIQTDAAVNPGNSGGPLIDLDGGVVGVVFADAGENLGFAISGQLAEEVLPTLKAGEEYEHSYLGVQLGTVTPTVATANDLPDAKGVYVMDVLEDAPADGRLRGSTGRTTVHGQTVPTGGDVIVQIDQTQIPHLDALSAHLALETRPGRTIDITVLRDGAERRVELTLGSRPTQASPFP